MYINRFDIKEKTSMIAAAFINIGLSITYKAIEHYHNWISIYIYVFSFFVYFKYHLQNVII